MLISTSRWLGRLGLPGAPDALKAYWLVLLALYLIALVCAFLPPIERALSDFGRFDMVLLVLAVPYAAPVGGATGWALYRTLRVPRDLARARAA